jgi:hypothetical protein
MAINGINGSGFNPYGVGSRPTVNAPTAPVPTRATDPSSNAGNAGSATDATNASHASNGASTPQRSVADAIKSDAAARAAAVNSSKAPDGVDQDLWSVLSKEERSFFVKAGAMGPLTYGRFSSGQAPTQAPLVRGGRLDIKA